MLQTTLSEEYGFHHDDCSTSPTFGEDPFWQCNSNIHGLHEGALIRSSGIDHVLFSWINKYKMPDTGWTLLLLKFDCWATKITALLHVGWLKLAIWAQALMTTIVVQVGAGEGKVIKWCLT